MSDDAPSFVRGIFSGVIDDALLFPYPAPRDERAVARGVREAGGDGVTSAILSDHADDGPSPNT